MDLWQRNAHPGAQARLAKLIATDIGAARLLLQQFLLLQSYPEEVARRVIGQRFDDLKHLQPSLAGLSVEEDARASVIPHVAVYLDEAGAMVACLNGLDVLAFSGGIGEHDAVLRQQVCDGLSHLGVIIDPALNRQASGDKVAAIHAGESRVEIWVVPTDEGQVAGDDAPALARGAHQPDGRQVIVAKSGVGGRFERLKLWPGTLAASGTAIALEDQGRIKGNAPGCQGVAIAGQAFLVVAVPRRPANVGNALVAKLQQVFGRQAAAVVVVDADGKGVGAHLLAVTVDKHDGYPEPFKVLLVESADARRGNDDAVDPLGVQHLHGGELALGFGVGAGQDDAVVVVAGRPFHGLDDLGDKGLSLIHI